MAEKTRETVRMAEYHRNIEVCYMVTHSIHQGYMMWKDEEGEGVDQVEEGDDKCIISSNSMPTLMTPMADAFRDLHKLLEQKVLHKPEIWSAL
eukprot:c19170_g2_i1 orf=844-1122(+)